MTEQATNKAPKADVELVLGWKDLNEPAKFRRNEAGFGEIKKHVEQARPDGPLKLNAFLYAFLCAAKNLDLFLTENPEAISQEINTISENMDQLAEFERDARPMCNAALCQTYLELRKVVARPTARDERRTLATLLFSGTSTAEQIAEDLGISANLANRVLRALGPVLEDPDAKSFTLRADTDCLAVVLHLLRSTLGVDPVTVLRRRPALMNSQEG